MNKIVIKKLIISLMPAHYNNDNPIYGYLSVVRYLIQWLLSIRNGRDN